MNTLAQMKRIIENRGSSPDALSFALGKLSALLETLELEIPKDWRKGTPIRGRDGWDWKYSATSEDADTRRIQYVPAEKWNRPDDVPSNGERFLTLLHGSTEEKPYVLVAKWNKDHFASSHTLRRIRKAELLAWCHMPAGYAAFLPPPYKRVTAPPTATATTPYSHPSPTETKT